MKSLLGKVGIIFIGFLILSYAEVWGEDWKSYWDDPFASYYYDADKVSHPTNKIVQVWQKIVYTKNGAAQLVARMGEKFKSASFSIDLIEFDCLGGQYKELQRTFFSQKATYLGEQSNLSLGSVNQGSIQEKLCKIACKSVEENVKPIESKPSKKEGKRSTSKASKKRR